MEFSKIRSWKPERGGLRQPVQPYTYDRLLVFDKTSAQPYFAVITCSDAVMSMFYSIVLTRSLIFCSYELLCHKRWVYFPPIFNLERWWFTFNAMTHKIRIVGVKEYEYYVNKLRQNVIWKHGYDVKMWRHKQHTPNTNDYHMPLREIPPMKIFCVRHCSTISIVFEDSG